jgi:hypothetical protein
MTGDERRRAVAIYAVLLMLLGLFFIFGGPPDRTLFWDGLFDAGHVLLFAASTLLAVRLALSLDTGPRIQSWRAAQVFVGMMLLAPLSEVVQMVQPSRNPSLNDVLRDSAGVIAVWLWWLPSSSMLQSVTSWRLGAALRIAGAAVLVLAIGVPLASIARVYDGRKRAMPDLVRLDGSNWERRLVRVRNARLTPSVVVTDGETRRVQAPATLALRPGRYPGIALNEPYPDWTPYRQLVFDVESPDGAPRGWTVRVHDASHNGDYRDRFNREFVLTGGRQTITIPLEDVRRAPVNREMDMRHIRGVAMFAWELDHAAQVEVGPLRLE